ncbi:MAG: protein-L-isoaspartate(D-aspartate) O-methyltransferase [Nevskia sp.]|nr:protein-L-isoaspartate(D-aspartate) O-methyltransferase [Nevskia sp.]
MKPGSHPHSLGLGLTSPASRARLVAELKREGIVDERVLETLMKVPRHEFVEEAWRGEAYKNKPLPIGQSQTISQPYIVALMTQLLLEVPPGGAPRKKVLEVGTGSGYQTAVLAELVQNVFSVERLKALSEQARNRLRGLGYRNIHFGYADGTGGWASHGPYDGIVVTAAAVDVPKALLEQLEKGGRLVIPVGPPAKQSLRVIDRVSPNKWQSRDVAGVSFVPLLEGKA